MEINANSIFCMFFLRRWWWWWWWAGMVSSPLHLRNDLSQRPSQRPLQRFATIWPSTGDMALHEKNMKFRNLKNWNASNPFIPSNTFPSRVVVGLSTKLLASHLVTSDIKQKTQRSFDFCELTRILLQWYQKYPDVNCCLLIHIQRKTSTDTVLS